MLERSKYNTQAGRNARIKKPDPVIHIRGGRGVDNTNSIPPTTILYFRIIIIHCHDRVEQNSQFRNPPPASGVRIKSSSRRTKGKDHRVTSHPTLYISHRECKVMCKLA